MGLLAAGYAVGRYRPARRASDWAHWHRYGDRPTGARHAAVWTILSAENLGWLAVHPRQGWQAWKRRNDPPPPRSPAVRVTRTTNRTVTEEDA
ncbi:hypothetical protein ADL27_54955 [Streptomyces sp. NRRL F-6602]|nr:hypothetical protein ADL27_54955 [Streptomyces sp. NRRL F-6602]